MIKALWGERIDRWIQRALPFLFRRSLNPNMLTATGAAISVVSAIAFAQGRFVAGGLLLLFGGVFDLVDGVVARHSGRASTFGAFLDSSVDRFVDMVVLLGILMHYAHQGAVGYVLLSGTALIASVLVSYAKARAERFVPDFGGGVLERGERVAILALGALSGLMVPALWIVALGASFTVVQRFAQAYRAMEQLDAAAREKLEGPV